MRWKRCLVVGVVLLAICVAVVGIFGRTYTWKQELYVALPSTDDLQVTLNQDDEIIRIEDVRLDGKVVEVTVSGVAPGRAFVTLWSPLMEGSHPTARFDVHSGGVITQDRFFGKCTGGIVFPLAALVFCGYVMVELVRAYRRSMAHNLYRYRNVTGLGLIIFLAFVILALALAVPQTGGLDDTVRRLMESTAFLTYLVLPLAFVVSLVVPRKRWILRKVGGVLDFTGLCAYFSVSHPGPCCSCVLSCVPDPRPSPSALHCHGSAWLRVLRCTG